MKLSPQHRSDLTNTMPTDVIGPYPQWSEPGRIVAMDPWGAAVNEMFASELASGYDIRPTFAVTQARVILPEVIEALQSGRLKADGKFLTTGGAAMVTKVAVEPMCFCPKSPNALTAPMRTCAACCLKKPAACIPNW